MSTTSNKSKVIAKNTLLLYFRMLLLMFISLFTSRVVLNALGVDNYGIYNVVGGVVAMFSIVSASLSAAISRYITFELGKNDIDRVRRVFCSSLNIQFIIIIIIVILLETVGLWFLNNKMVIPSDRMVAANWVFQFSIITFAINLWSVPYSATIVAHEKMAAFAYISIFDGIAKLSIAFLILYNPFDRLIYYGLLVMIVSIIQRFLYTSYCTRHFQECKYSIIIDRNILKEMLGFTGWNFIGASAVILRDQGGNIIINLFFGPVVNAARGIAMSVNSAVIGFVSNFMVALNPQITKSYASGDMDYMYKLAFQGARFSYYIILILALPIIFCTPFLLRIWLGIVPEYASSFARLVLMFSMSESLASPLITIMLATGNIRNYQLIVGGIQLLNLPLSYIGLKLGFPPQTIFVVAILTSIMSEFARLIMLNRMIGLSVKKFLKDVYLNVLSVTAVAASAIFVIKLLWTEDNLTSFIVICVMSLCITIFTIYTIGCNKQDRHLIRSYARTFINKLR